MIDLIIIAVLVITVGGAAVYIAKAKKSGAKCIGCPAEGGCPHKRQDGASGPCSCRK